MHSQLFCLLLTVATLATVYGRDSHRDADSIKAARRERILKDYEYEPADERSDRMDRRDRDRESRRRERDRRHKSHGRGFDHESGDFSGDIDNGAYDRHSMHRSRHGSRGAEFEEERHEKFLNMNVRRADNFKKRVQEAGFNPDKEAELFAEIEVYHDKEAHVATRNKENKQRDRDAFGRMNTEERKAKRDSEKAEREDIRNMRADIERKIVEQTRGNEL